MKAANRQREMEGSSPAYGEKHFREVPDTYQIGWNSVIEYLREG